MKRIMLAIALACLMSSSLFAANQWIGDGNTACGISKATVKLIRVFNGNNAVFWINESSVASSIVTNAVPGTRYWNIDMNTAWGKNAYALILAAKASNSFIQIYELTGSGDSYTLGGLSFGTF